MKEALKKTACLLNDFWKDEHGGPPEIDPNKLRHIFDKDDHNLTKLVEAANSREEAFRAVEKAVQQKADNGEIADRYETIVDVLGNSVTVRGKVIGGKARIGSFWVK